MSRVLARVLALRDGTVHAARQISVTATSALRNANLVLTATPALSACPVIILIYTTIFATCPIHALMALLPIKKRVHAMRVTVEEKFGAQIFRVLI